MYLTPRKQFLIRISLWIFVKNWNRRSVFLMGTGGAIWWKNNTQKSLDTVPLILHGSRILTKDNNMNFRKKHYKLHNTPDYKKFWIELIKLDVPLSEKYKRIKCPLVIECLSCFINFYRYSEPNEDFLRILVKVVLAIFCVLGGFPYNLPRTICTSIQRPLLRMPWWSVLDNFISVWCPLRIFWWTVQDFFLSLSSYI